MKTILKFFVLGIGLYLTTKNIPLTGTHSVTVGLFLGVVLVFWALASFLAQKKERKQNAENWKQKPISSCAKKFLISPGN